LGTPVLYIECLQFFVAPTDLAGANPDPKRAPHVIEGRSECCSCCCLSALQGKRTSSF